MPLQIFAEAVRKRRQANDGCPWLSDWQVHSAHITAGAIGALANRAENGPLLKQPEIEGNKQYIWAKTTEIGPEVHHMSTFLLSTFCLPLPYGKDNPETCLVLEARNQGAIHKRRCTHRVRCEGLCYGPKILHCRGANWGRITTY